jgi:UV DNA damage endonuclease
VTLRLGLCCTFHDVPIKFRHTTAAYVLRQPEARRRPFVAELVAHNADALSQAVRWCAEHRIHAFRVQNDIVPLVTHPELGFRLDDLDPALLDALCRAGAEARSADVRLSFHPDQFVVLGSARDEVVRSSLAELEHLGHLGALLGAVQMTVHGGGAAGGKDAAAERLLRGIDRLSERARGLLVLENDDRVWTVEDLLPVVRASGLPLVYDVHHHRCNADRLTVEEATRAAVATWGEREPWMHVSSPAEGWSGPKPLRHADFIDPADVPEAWRGLSLTVDVEAKRKEQAVLALRDALAGSGWPVRG